MIFFIIFVIISLTEISLFAYIGGEIGLGYTLLLCFLTAMIGATLIRQQGLQTLISAKGTMAQGGLPINAIFDGVCLAVSGALLMTPGFFTDFIGFSLLIPQVRAILRNKITTHFDLHTQAQSGNFRQEQTIDIIEAEYEKLDDDE